MTRRLVWSYVVITFVVLATLAYPLGRVFASRERDRLFRDIEHDAIVIAGLVEDSLERKTEVDIDDVLVRYAKDPGGRIVVVDADGRSVADSQASANLGSDWTNRVEIAAALSGTRAEGERRSNTLQATLLYVAIPVASGGVVHGAVRVTYPSSALDKRIQNMWLALVSVGLLAVGAAGAVGFGLARLVTRPVERLEAAARRIADGDLDARAPTDSGAPELRQLATVFNQSAEQVQAALAAQAAFVADASHQLRTPLAALRLQLENVESAVPPSLQPNIAAARAETARLTRISDTLLTLTRASSLGGTIGPTDLSAAIARCVERWRPVAAGFGVDLTCAIRNDVWVAATDDALDQILDNLVDNALDVSPNGSAVDLQVDGDEATVRLHVLDRGPGLTVEQRERAFDRFWRGPHATPGGTGLGLPIVRQLALACGGDAALHSRVGGGSDATVSLPTSRPIRVD